RRPPWESRLGSRKLYISGTRGVNEGPPLRQPASPPGSPFPPSCRTGSRGASALSWPVASRVFPGASVLVVVVDPFRTAQVFVNEAGSGRRGHRGQQIVEERVHPSVPAAVDPLQYPGLCLVQVAEADEPR